MRTARNLVGVDAFVANVSTALCSHALMCQRPEGGSRSALEISQIGG
jgi:hypothetical protein